MRGYNARLGVLTLGSCLLLGGTGARADVCERAAFEAVVEDASSALVTLTRTNTPTFQTKLRALKDKKGWTQDRKSVV